MKLIKIGVLALQGNVGEHKNALARAAENLKIKIEITLPRTKDELEGLDAIILPGGESTTLSLLLQKEDMFSALKKIPKIFGTCAGLILLAKRIKGRVNGQRSLELIDIEVNRNAYGTQYDSFESKLKCDILPDEKIMFIRAPKINRIDKKQVSVLATLPDSEQPVIVEQKTNTHYLLGATCHPEMSTTKIHEYFLRKIRE